MTDKVTLRLPSGRERSYKVGDRVEIRSGCPECELGCVGEITTIVDRSLVVWPDGAGRPLNPISCESLYVKPLSSTICAA